MKKEYVRPMALVEAFVANSYVATCKYDVSKGNSMACINPRHPHSIGVKHVFGSVWIDATSTSCSIIITADSPKTEVDWNNAKRPIAGTTVYAEDGKAYICDSRWGGYNVPSFVSDAGLLPDGGQCYGAYRNEGSYEDLSANVLS